MYSVVSMSTPFSLFSRLKKNPIRNGGRVAIVTDGASGIGSIIADTLLKEGWKVVVFVWSPIRQSKLVLVGDIGMTKKMIYPD